VADDHYVIITFHEFDINKSRHECFVDNLEIHDGYTEDSPFLGNIWARNFISLHFFRKNSRSY
jgi:hypothetical protein